MNPAIWGGLSALGLGCADFAARFSSRAIGHGSALLGMLTVGALVLSTWVWLTAPPLVWALGSAWLVALNGAATAVMTLLLYKALARGPVTIVAPIVAGHPVLVVAFWIALGTRPSAVQWAAMAATVAGVIVVARAARRFEEPGTWTRQHLRTTILISLASALAYGVLVVAGQLAAPVYGELQTVWLGRWVGILTVLAVFAAKGEAPNLPLRWWPFLVAQGMLDAGGYLFLFAGSRGEGAEIAAVTASAFGAVTVVLARVVLREAMSAPQWAGIALVFAGVAILTAGV